jgi:hypothetical protein
MKIIYELIFLGFVKPHMPDKLRYGASALNFQENIRDKIGGTK